MPFVIIQGLTSENVISSETPIWITANHDREYALAAADSSRTPASGAPISLMTLIGS